MNPPKMEGKRPWPPESRSAQMTTAQPFRPFAIKLASGGSFEVRHPENVACSVNREEMTV